MILHFIILSRQQRTAFTLSSTPSPFSSSLQPDGSLLFWLAVSSSVCVCCLQCTLWLAVVQGRLLCGWLREPSGIWTWCRYSSDAAALSPFFLTTNQVKVTRASDFSTSFLSGLPFFPHSHYKADKHVSLCVVSSGLSLCLSVCLQGRLSCLSGCSEMSGTLNVLCGRSYQFWLMDQGIPHGYK